jgi:AraC-like DNA-binding protein
VADGAAFEFVTTDLDEARALIASYFYPVTLDLARRTERFRFAMKAVQAGPLTFGAVSQSGDLRIGTQDLITAYHINVLTDGRMASVHRGQQVLADPAMATVYQPVGDNVAQFWSEPATVLSIKVDRAALDDHLSTLLDRTVRTPLDLAPEIDLSTDAARGWVALVKLLAKDLYRPDGLTRVPPVADHLFHAVLSGLLMAVDHPYRHQLVQPTTGSRPRTVKRAIDAMQADPAHPYSIAELARIAGVSVRTLQDGFRRHVQITPMAYLRDLRLARIHDDLRRAEPGRTTIADVAQRWGFTHLGRFAAAYRHRYGRHPSTTLHTR